MSIKLYRVSVPVKDIASAMNFYTKLLDQEGKLVSPGRYCFDLGGMVLMLFDSIQDGHDEELPPNPDLIYFSTDDLEKVFERAKKSGCFWLEDSIKDRRWGERSFYAQDPFENSICFIDEKTAIP